MCNNPNESQPNQTSMEAIESLRRRMLRELEEFLSEAIRKPFPRLQIKPQPANRRYTVSLN